MAYRVKFTVNSAQSDRLRELGFKATQVTQPILNDAALEVKRWAVQNLSGVPFTSETGTHTIHKNTGKGAASIQVQVPYGSPFRARIFAYQGTRYADNPETYNYLKILEEGRGEVRPKYTPSMRAGRPDRARLAIPGDEFDLVFGVKGFRGITGRYIFLKSLPPMEGKYWMRAAVRSAQPAIKEITSDHLQSLIDGNI